MKRRAGIMWMSDLYNAFGLIGSFARIGSKRPRERHWKFSIQVGGIYFVRDGHHRISVALARGQEVIDAEVIVIEYRGSLPWQTRNDSKRSQMQTKPEPRYCSVVSGR